MRIVTLFAMEDEARPFAARLRAIGARTWVDGDLVVPDDDEAAWTAASVPGPGAETRHVRLGSHHLRLAVTGFGKVAAAETAARVAAGTDLVLVVGVCGRLVAGGDDTFWVSHAVQHDYGALRRGRLERYTAGALPLGPASVEPFAAVDDPGLGLPHATIASGDTFVEDTERASEIADALGATLVDMETAAVAQVAARHAVPWAAIRAVTDDADDAGAGDFEANLAAAADRAAEAAIRLLDLLRH